MIKDGSLKQLNFYMKVYEENHIMFNKFRLTKSFLINIHQSLEAVKLSRFKFQEISSIT